MKNILENVLVKGDETPADSLAFFMALRREFHAGLVLQGMCAGVIRPGANDIDGPNLAAAAVKAADCLIAELDKPQA